MSFNRIIHLSKMTGAAGSEGHLLVLLSGLREHGLDVRLWILVEPDNPIPEYVNRAEALGIPTERFVIRHDLDVTLWQRLSARFRLEKPDIVHTHLLHADLYGIPAARRAGVPYIVSSRHNDDRFRHILLFRLLHRWLWRQIDAGIAISEAIRQFSIAVESASPDQIYTIHYGLDPAAVEAPPGSRAELGETLNIPADALIIGSVCRLIEQKGLMYAVRAFAQIADQIPEVHYVIAGDGLQRSALEAEIQTLGLAGRIHLLGWRSDAHAIMAALDLLVAPSLWEGFGLVFLEAMALCVPVVSTCVSAIPEVVVDGETGWLVPPGNVEVLAEVLRDALTHPVVMRQRGENARRRLEEQFTSQMMVDRTLDLYHQVAKGGCK